MAGSLLLAPAPRRCLCRGRVRERRSPPRAALAVRSVRPGSRDRWNRGNDLQTRDRERSRRTPITRIARRPGVKRRRAAALLILVGAFLGSCRTPRPSRGIPPYLLDPRLGSAADARSSVAAGGGCLW